MRDNFVLGIITSVICTIMHNIVFLKHFEGKLKSVFIVKEMSCPYWYGSIT